MKDLYPLINNLPAMEALNGHLDKRLALLKEQLVYATDWNVVVGLQRAINELTVLKGLRENYLASLEN